MGRTKRHRLRLKNAEKVVYLDHLPDVVKLTKWMKTYKWKNRTKLRLANFPDTGRGIAAMKSISANDNLVDIPYDLLISFTTVQRNEEFVRLFQNPCQVSRLSIHEILALFLVLEMHHVELSPWRHYLKTLPMLEEIPIAWPSSDFDTFPLELRTGIRHKSEMLMESFKHINECIDPKWRCSRCKRHSKRFINFGTYAWAYKIVNSRGVYVNPVTVRTLSGFQLSYLLADEPSMALCPFLDMFNHSAHVTSMAQLECRRGRWFFKLATGNAFKKHQQVFISYGQHSNANLFTEYGFSIMDNPLDSIKFVIEEIGDLCNFPMSDVQYKFIRQMRLDTDLEVSTHGVSFNMKAILYVLLYDFDYRNWKKTIFSGNFSEDCETKICQALKSLLEGKLAHYETELESVEVRICWGNVTFPSQNGLKLIVQYLRCRLLLLYDLIKKYYR